MYALNVQSIFANEHLPTYIQSFIVRFDLSKYIHVDDLKNTITMIVFSIITYDILHMIYNIYYNSKKT